MENKKWPILAQVIIALGVLLSIAGIVRGFAAQSWLEMILSIIGLIIYWNVYKLKKWARIGLNIFISLNIILGLYSIFFFYKGLFILLAVISVGISVFILFYFNSAKIKELFR